jgi:bile acid:Na+ symporter, BASS family
LEASLHHIQLNFNQGSLFVLNLSLAFIMYGVSLSLKKEDFLFIRQRPRSVLTGLSSQLVLLPALTLAFIWVMRPHPALALGMVLVAACPGGNVSNFFSMVARGNIALSVSLTAITTLLAVVMTPFNFSFWGQWVPGGQEMLAAISIDFWAMVKTAGMILGLPLVLGIWTAARFPKITRKIEKPIKYTSFLILVGFIIGAFMQNVEAFHSYFHLVIYLVFFHNALALVGGYLLARLLKNEESDCRTICLETGIQNSGLGLVLIFTFFGGNGPMAIVAAWWGIWHILSGSLVSGMFSRVFKPAIGKG